MSRAHSTEHEAALRMLLTGSDDREKLLASLAQCTLCQARLNELEAVVSGLASHPSDAPEQLPPFPAGEAAARRRLAELAAEEFPALATDATTARRRRRLMTGVFLAAAAVLAIVTLVEWPRRGTGPPDPSDHVIGIGAIEIEGPGEDAGKSWDAVTFSWSGELRPREKYLLLIWDENGRELTRATVATTSWRAPEGATRSWPDAIRWQVRIHHEVLGDTDDASKVVTARITP